MLGTLANLAIGALPSNPITDLTDPLSFATRLGSLLFSSAQKADEARRAAIREQLANQPAGFTPPTATSARYEALAARSRHGLLFRGYVPGGSRLPVIHHPALLTSAARSAASNLGPGYSTPSP